MRHVKVREKHQIYHLDRKTPRSNHYRFLYSVRANCVDCVSFWLQNGADVDRGTDNHQNWTAMVFAEHYKAYRRDGGGGEGKLSRVGYRV